jgi:hypothetical protein
MGMIRKFFSSLDQYVYNVGFALTALVIAFVTGKGTSSATGSWAYLWVWNTLVQLDKFANAVLLGDPNETISSRADKAALAGVTWGCVLCKLLNYVQKGHCQLSLEAEAGKLAIIKDDTP